MSGLLELAERIEAASGPDREIDREIAFAINLEAGDEYGGRQGWSDLCANGKRWADQCGFRYPHVEFTKSLDAAMTLVPEGWGWIAGDYLGKANAVRWQGRYQYSKGWASLTDSIGDEMTNIRCNGETPALALCAAALRARAEGESA